MRLWNEAQNSELYKICEKNLQSPCLTMSAVEIFYDGPVFPAKVCALYKPEYKLEINLLPGLGSQGQNQVKREIT